MKDGFKKKKKNGLEMPHLLTLLSFGLEMLMKERLKVLLLKKIILVFFFFLFRGKCR